MKKLLLLILLMGNLITSAQNNYKLGKVTIDELKEKVHPIDTSAAAAILFKKGNMYFKINLEGYWNVVTEVEVKIKIYKKEGYKYGNFEKSYYSGAYGEKIFITDAATYNLVDGKVEKTKLKSDGEFVEEIEKDYKTKKISLPNVKEGSIVEFKYEYVTYNTTELEEIYFQEEIPINFIEYKVRTPDYFEYKKTLNGYLVLNQKDELLKDTSGNYDEYRTTYSYTNSKAMKDEEYVNNVDNFRSHLNYELASKKDRNGMVEKFAQTWEDVIDKIYKHENFGFQLDKTNYYEDDLKVLLAGLTTNEEKMNVIFDFVKNRMSWNEYNGYNCKDGVKTAYKNKVGNIAEINLILISMLRSAGIEANPIILSTRKNGIKIFPSRTAFNYVIAGVEMPNKVVLLDASTKNGTPDIIPIRALNYIGRIIRKDGSSSQIDLIPKEVSNEVNYIIGEIDSNGIISGKARQQFFNYNGYLFRENHGTLSDDSQKERLEKKFKGIEIEDFEIQNAKDLKNPVVLNYDFSNSNAVEIIGDKMYFSPLLYFTMSENPFKQEVREYPVDFIFPYLDKYTINITIPEGYIVESMPKVTNISMEDEIANFKYNVLNTENKIQLSVNFNINSASIGPEYYDALKNFFKEVINKQNEKIVLKKA
jgi:hypothetical protein